MGFHGVKVAIIYEGELVLHLRDNKPELFNANMWDFPGGGREGTETPEECAMREVKEELGIELSTEDIIWKKTFPAQKDLTQQAVFMVAKIDKDRLDKIILGEGQRWKTFTEDEFFTRKDVIPALKERYQTYLESKLRF